MNYRSCPVLGGHYNGHDQVLIQRAEIRRPHSPPLVDDRPQVGIASEPCVKVGQIEVEIAAKLELGYKAGDTRRCQSVFRPDSKRDTRLIGGSPILVLEPNWRILPEHRLPPDSGLPQVVG